MNKTKKFFTYVLVCIIACFTMVLAACGGVEGTYKFQKLTYTEGGMTIEMEAGEQFMGMITLSEDFVSLTLNADGSAVMTMKMDSEEVTTGTWTKAEDDKIVLTFGGEDQVVSCDGKTIEIEAEGMKFVLKK